MLTLVEGAAILGAMEANATGWLAADGTEKAQVGLLGGLFRGIETGRGGGDSHSEFSNNGFSRFDF